MKFINNLNYFSKAKNNEVQLYYDNDEFIELSKDNKPLLIVNGSKIKPITLSKNFSLFFNDDPNTEISFLYTDETVSI